MNRGNKDESGWISDSCVKCVAVHSRVEDRTVRGAVRENMGMMHVSFWETASTLTLATERKVKGRDASFPR